MFYSTQILSKKGALGTIWIASHIEHRLKRSQIFETSIAASVDSVLQPEAPLALRLSGQLLLGIVRVYLRKLNYLESDAAHAVRGIDKAGAGGSAVDLPDGGTAPEVAITLPPDSLGGGTLGLLHPLGALFPSFEPEALPLAGTPGGGSGGLGLGGGQADNSLTAAADLSEAFGSGWALEDERFEAGGDEIDRRFSVELERLRAAAATEEPRSAGPGGAPGMFFEGGGDDYGPQDMGGSGGDELMEAPPEELLLAAGQLASGAPLPGTASMRVTPASAARPAPSGGGAPSLLGSDMLPDLGEAPGSVATSWGGPSDSEAPASYLGPAGEAPARRRRAPAGRRKAHADVGPNGEPLTQLPAAEIRSLLADRAPILKQRGQHGTAERPCARLAPGRYDAARYEGAGGPLDRLLPAGLGAAAPQLAALFERALGAGARSAGAPAPGPEGGAAAAGDAGAPWHATDGDRAGPLMAPPSPSGLTGGGYGGSLGDFGDDGGGAPSEFGGGEAFAAGEEAEGQLRQQPADAGGASPFDLGTTDSRGDGSSAGGSGGTGRAARDGFTARTRTALEFLQARLLPSVDGAAAAPSVSLGALVAGRSRLEAARWFFEALVLKGRGYVELDQDEPYADIRMRAAPGLAAATPVRE